MSPKNSSKLFEIYPGISLKNFESVTQQGSETSQKVFINQKKKKSIWIFEELRNT